MASPSAQLAGAAARMGSALGARAARARATRSSRAGSRAGTAPAQARKRLARPHRLDGAGKLGGARRRSAQIGLDASHALDQPLERVVHGLERILGALVAFGVVCVQRLEVAPHLFVAAARNVGDDRARDALGGRDRFLARLAHLHRQMLDAALDPGKVGRALPRGLESVGEPHDAALELRQRRVIEGGGIAAIELVGEAHDAGLELRERGLVAGRRMVGVIEPVGQRLDERLQVGRERPDLLDPRVERMGELVDTLRERVEAGRTGRRRDVIDPRAERVHVAGKRGDALGRGDAVRELAHLVDRGLEIAQQLRIGRRRVPDPVDLVGELGDALVEARERLGRGHRVEAILHLGKAPLDAFQRRRVDAAVVAALDPFGERVHVGL